MFKSFFNVWFTSPQTKKWNKWLCWYAAVQLTLLISKIAPSYRGKHPRIFVFSSCLYLLFHLTFHRWKTPSSDGSFSPRIDRLSVCLSPLGVIYGIPLFSTYVIFAFFRNLRAKSKFASVYSLKVEKMWKFFFLYVPSLLIDSSTDMGVPPQRFSLLFFARKYAGTLRFTRILLQTGRFVLFHLVFVFFFPFDKKIPPDVTIPL